MRIDRNGLDCPCIDHTACPGRVLERLAVDTRSPLVHGFKPNAECDTCKAWFHWDGDTLRLLQHAPTL